jgi:hypothetical protein
MRPDVARAAEQVLAHERYKDLFVFVDDWKKLSERDKKRYLPYSQEADFSLPNTWSQSEGLLESSSLEIQEHWSKIRRAYPDLENYDRGRMTWNPDHYLSEMSSLPSAYTQHAAASLEAAPSLHPYSRRDMTIRARPSLSSIREEEEEPASFGPPLHSSPATSQYLSSNTAPQSLLTAGNLARLGQGFGGQQNVTDLDYTTTVPYSLGGHPAMPIRSMPGSLLPSYAPSFASLAQVPLGPEKLENLMAQQQKLDEGLASAGLTGEIVDMSRSSRKRKRLSEALRPHQRGRHHHKHGPSKLHQQVDSTDDSKLASEALERDPSGGRSLAVSGAPSSLSVLRPEEYYDTSREMPIEPQPPWRPQQPLSYGTDFASTTGPTFMYQDPRSLGITGSTASGGGQPLSAAQNKELLANVKPKPEKPEKGTARSEPSTRRTRETNKTTSYEKFFGVRGSR